MRVGQPLNGSLGSLAAFPRKPKRGIVHQTLRRDDELLPGARGKLDFEVRRIDRDASIANPYA